VVNVLQSNIIKEMSMSKNVFNKVLSFVMCFMLVGSAVAANYTLWVNGRGGGGQDGNYADFKYWGPATIDAGVNKKAVNWNGKDRIATKNYQVRDALDCFCTGPNWCYIGAHSAGNLQIGYALSLFGGSTRQVKNTTPNASGVCGNVAGNGTQTGWNIKWVNVASGAAGGSELSDVGSWAVSEPMVSDLKTTTSRAMYDHNQTRAKWFNMYAGAKGTVYSFILPGQDDEAVSYHSTGGAAGSGGRALCNPSDWWCDDLTLGTAANEGGSRKWSYHTVKLRDDKEQFDHYARSQWQGIIDPVRKDMVINAR
jgi:hypothetical protein